MKIICPEHNGPIEVPDKDISDAMNGRARSLVFNCPVCRGNVLIENIQLAGPVRPLPIGKRFN